MLIIFICFVSGMYLSIDHIITFLGYREKRVSVRDFEYLIYIYEERNMTTIF